MRILPTRVVVGLCIVFLLINAIPALAAEEEIFLKGVVLEVSSALRPQGSLGDMEQQLVTVRLLERPWRGEVVQITNMITGQPYYDLIVEPGDRVMVQVEEVEGEAQFLLTDFARDRSLAWVTLAFVGSLVLVGGLKGLKALISLVVMGLAVLYLLLPLILRGYSPVLLTVGLSSLLTVVFLLFIGGFNRKTVAAIAGTIGGLAIAGGLAFAAGKSAYLTGLSSSEAQMLQFFDGQINAQGLLFAGMIVGALGAILDVGMSVSSAIEQIKETDPQIGLTDLIMRGLNVGRDMLGTMANTLILAYIGTSLPLLLLFQAYDTPWLKILNMDLIATEVVRAMAGSTGLALAVPLTAVAAGLLQNQRIFAPVGTEENSQTKQE